MLYLFPRHDRSGRYCGFHSCPASSVHLVRIMDFNTFIGISHTDDETAVGADLSRPPPIYRPKGGSKILGLICSSSLSAQIRINLSALTISPFASLRACLLLPTVTHSL